MKIDIKSLIIGVLITVVVLLALGASHSTGSHSCGRYQFAAGENNYAYVIDTSTGQVWSKSGTGREEFWKPKNLPTLSRKQLNALGQKGQQH